MKKLLLSLLLLFVSHVTANTLEKPSNTVTQSPQWEMKQQSENKHFDVTLVCLSIPNVGTFQDCQLTVTTSNTQQLIIENPSKKEDKTILINNAKIVLEGGMPAHHHGLPTSPIVRWSATNNAYQIKGLKFSMPGDWFLRFHIKNSDSTLIDKAEFKFSID